MASKYLPNLSFILCTPVTGSTHFFDSSCSFFVSYVHGFLLAADDLQYFAVGSMPSRAPGTASPNRCTRRPWYARPIDRGLGSSQIRVWRSPVENTHNVEPLLECLGCLAESVVSALWVQSSSSGGILSNSYPNGCLLEALQTHCSPNTISRSHTDAPTIPRLRIKNIKELSSAIRGCQVGCAQQGSRMQDDVCSVAGDLGP